MLMSTLGVISLHKTVVSVKQEKINWSRNIQEKKLKFLRFLVKYANLDTTDNKEDFNP